MYINFSFFFQLRLLSLHCCMSHKVILCGTALLLIWVRRVGAPGLIYISGVVFIQQFLEELSHFCCSA